MTKATGTKSKKDVIKEYQTHAKDTGSSKVQVAVLTSKIASLTDHLKAHKKDNHSRRGLIGMVGQRRKLLRYMKNNDATAHSEICKELSLRG